MNEFVAVLDPARKADRYPFMISRHAPVHASADPEAKIITPITIVYLDQWAGMPWAASADRVARVLGHARMAGNTDLLVDGTGIGDAAIEPMYDIGLSPIPIIVTGGNAVREVTEGFGQGFKNQGNASILSGFRAVKEYHVPKSDLVAAGQLMLEQRRFSLAKGLRWVEELQRQLESITAKETKSGNTRYESGDNQVHDDMAFCFMLTAWWCLRRAKQGIVLGKAASPQRDWEPRDYM